VRIQQTGRAEKDETQVKQAGEERGTDGVSDSAKLWDQIEGESPEAYARFLVYRNLGIGRSVASAIETLGKSGKKRNGQWEHDSSEFNWVDRAAAWDISNAKRVGESVVLMYIETLKAMWAKTLAVAVDKTTKPRGWEELIETVTTLGAFIPQETVAGIRRSIEDTNSVPAIGTSGEHRPE
jgi:hypothetical protein